MDEPDSPAASARDRLTELESKLAFAEDLLNALNRTVASQQTQIDLLQEQLRLLNRQIKDVQTADARSPREEIPPHY
jgi:SlyX protein